MTASREKTHNSPEKNRSPRVASLKKRERIIVSTGHRVDAEDRPTPRFPADAAYVEQARQAIREAVRAEKDHTPGRLQGLSGAASGNDLLFLEVCRALDIPTRIVLAYPKDEYCRKSVADSGPEWVERFHRMTNQAAEEGALLVLRKDQVSCDEDQTGDYGMFQQSNIWMLEYAFSLPETDVTLLALWNGEGGDGPGGTADMVELARERGAKVVHLDTRTLFDLGSAQ